MDYLVSRSDFWVGQGASMLPWIIWSVGLTFGWVMQGASMPLWITWSIGLTSGWGRVLLRHHGLSAQ